MESKRLVVKVVSNEDISQVSLAEYNGTNPRPDVMFYTLDTDYVDTFVGKLAEFIMANSTKDGE